MHGIESTQGRENSGENFSRRPFELWGGRVAILKDG